MARAVGREMENIHLRSFSLSSMKNHAKTIMMKDVSRVPESTRPTHLTLSGLSHVPTVTRPPGNSFNSMKSKKPISIEKIIRLVKRLLSRLFGFLSLTKRPCAPLTNNF